MRTNAKFDRRVNIRSRSSDLRIVLYASATALSVGILFFGLFSYRRPEKGNDVEDTHLTMLTADDFPAAQREGFRNWIEYHDPRNSIRCRIGDGVVCGGLRDVRPAGLKSDLCTDIPVRPAVVAGFREVAGGGVPPRTLPPGPPRVRPAPVFAAGGVRDGEGNVLPLENVKLPPRTPRTVGRTELRVLNGGDTPALLLQYSCGDAALDSFAMRSLAFLARRDPAPEFIIVEWPEGEK